MNLSVNDGKPARRRRYDARALSVPSNIIVNVLLGAFVAMCILPLLLVLAVSLSTESDLNAYGYLFIPRHFNLSAYTFVFRDFATIARSYGVTTFVTVAGSVVSTAFIAFYAYPISRKDFRYKNLFSFLVFFTMLFNGGLVPWYMVYVNLLQIKDTLWVLIIPGLVTPFFVLIMRSFFITTIPDSLIESAKIDGANDVVVFFSIVLPLGTAGLATIALFNMLAYWNDWFRALLFINSDKLYPLQFLMYRLQITIQILKDMAQRGANIDFSTANIPQETAKMAMCILSIGPIVLAYPFFQRYFVKGLTLGAIKG